MISKHLSRFIYIYIYILCIKYYLSYLKRFIVVFSFPHEQDGQKCRILITMTGTVIYTLHYNENTIIIKHVHKS